MVRKNKVMTSRDYETALLLEYSRWKKIFDVGCSDPSYPDGVNINLVRNHILHYKNQVEHILKDNFLAYPDSYFYPDPLELPNDFMAVDRKASCTIEGFLTANKTMSYNEVIKFDWSEVLCS